MSKTDEIHRFWTVVEQAREMNEPNEMNDEMSKKIENN